MPKSILLFLLPTYIFAQINTDSLLKINHIQKIKLSELTRYEVDTQIYHYCRLYKKAILQELKNNNLDNIKKLYLKEYIVKIRNNKTKPDTIMLYDNYQRTLLNTISGDYKTILTDIKENNFGFVKLKKGMMIGKSKWNKNYRRPVFFYPLDFIVTDALRNYIRNNYFSFVSFIDSSELAEDEKDFLKLYIYAVQNDFNYCETTDSILNQANTFLINNQKSSFKDYVEKNIFINNKLTKWTIAGSILGTGFNFFTGENSKYFRPSIYIPLYLWFDASYGKIYFSTSFLGTIGRKLKKDIDNKWPKDSSVFQVVGDINVGYSIIDNEKLRISPYIGLMTNAFVQNFESEENQSDNSNLSNKQPFSFGITIDKAISYYDCFPSILGNKEKYAEYLRFKIGYINPQYHIGNKIIKGGMIYFQFSLISRDFIQKKIKYKLDE